MLMIRRLRVGLGALVAVAVLAGAARAAPPPALREQQVTVLGQRIHFVEAGRGQPVILLHGLGASKETWWAILPTLAARFHVYAIDQIGFGQSDKPALDYKIATFVDFLDGFLASQHLPRAILIGNSLGGWVALAFAVQHPEKLDRLVLVDSAGLPWLHPPPVDLNPASLAATRALLEALFYDQALVSDSVVRQVFADHLRNNDGYTVQRALTGFGAQFMDKALGTLHVPTLVVWGQDDVLIPVAAGEQLRDGIAGAMLDVIPRCGHLPQVEKPVELTRAVMAFLGS